MLLNWFSFASYAWAHKQNSIPNCKWVNMTFFARKILDTENMQFKNWDNICKNNFFYHKVFGKLITMQFRCDYFVNADRGRYFIFTWKTVKSFHRAHFSAVIQLLQCFWRWKSVQSTQKRVPYIFKSNKVETSFSHEICCTHYGKYTKLLLPVCIMKYSLKCMCTHSARRAQCCFKHIFLISASGFPLYSSSNTHTHRKEETFL